MHHIYNLKRDRRDARDRMRAEPPANLVLPTSVDMRPQMPPVYDQGNLGSCSANAIAAALDVLHAAANAGAFFTPSRLFIYYEERRMEGSIGDDSGACLRDGIKVVNHEGACPESVWPYDITQFTVQPPDDAYNQARSFEAIQYERVPISLLNIKAALAAGLPVVVGITIYDSFESDVVAQTGVVPMPDTVNEQELGGHAVLIVGYDDAAQTFLLRNSCSESWGMAGYFTLPQAYIQNPTLTSDAWAIQKAT
jgi:C1A family cysteine protease